MGRVVNTADYTFNKTAKTITFSSKYTGIELAQIQLITDVTNSTVIYQFNKVGYGGTLAGLVLTLAYDTTGAGFNNTDNLMIIVNETQDNTVLYSGTLTNTGSISGVDTTDFQTVSIQVSGSWEGIVMVEGSNDNSYYIPLMTYPINEFTLVDNINEDGIYNLTTPTRFVRLNVVQLVTGSINTLIHGRTVAGPNAVDGLSLAMDRTQNMPLNVQEVNGSPGVLRKDSSNALILSDGNVVLTVNRAFAVNDIMATIDTQGYQLMAIHMINGGGTFTQIVPQGSNDGINYSTSALSVYALSASPLSPNTYISPNNNSWSYIPCTTRFIRIICPQAGTFNFVVALRNQPSPLVVPGSTTGIGVFATAPSNVTSNNAAGGNTLASGYNVAGPNLPGSTTVAQPVIVGGRQAPTSITPAGITRVLLTDSDGRTQVGLNVLDQAKTIGTQLQAISNNFQNGNSLSVTDLSQTEGQGRDELLYQILLEMRIMNQYMSELPQKLNAGLNNLDEPSQFRNDPSVFTL